MTATLDQVRWSLFRRDAAARTARRLANALVRRAERRLDRGRLRRHPDLGPAILADLRRAEGLGREDVGELADDLQAALEILA